MRASARVAAEGRAARKIRAKALVRGVVCSLKRSSLNSGGRRLAE
jgi:hypothetical protein